MEQAKGDIRFKLSILNENLFIPFTDILATRYGIIGVDDEEKPFRIKNAPLSAAIKQYFGQNSFSDKNIKDIERLYFITLHPERTSINYIPSNNDMYNC